MTTQELIVICNNCSIKFTIKDSNTVRVAPVNGRQQVLGTRCFCDEECGTLRPYDDQNR